MKLKLINIVSMLAAGGLLFASCGRDEGEYEPGPVAVKFGSEIGTPTRTTAGGTQWTAGDEIGIFMVKGGQTSDLSKTVEGAVNRRYKADVGNNNKTTFSPLSSSETIYFPQNGDRVDFVAYYPWRGVAVDPLTGKCKYSVSIKDQTDQSAIDILYANTDGTGNYHKGNTSVELSFIHAMSKLQFNLMPGDGDPDLTGAGIHIPLIVGGSIDLADGSYSVNAGGLGTVAANADTQSIIMLPQNVSGLPVSVTLANGDKFETTMPTGWNTKQNMVYNFNITVNKTGITVTAGNITLWGGTTNPATPGEAERVFSVGDYWPDPLVVYDPTSAGTVLSGTRAEGVVIWVDPADARHGKILGLKENPGGKYGPSVDELALGIADIRDWEKGYSATRGFIEKHKDESNFQNNYPHFYWIYRTMNSGDIDGKWYLPAMNLLMDIYNNFYIVDPAFNDKLRLAGGDQLNATIYWSVNEYDYFHGYGVQFNNKGSVLTASKNQYRSTRCVKDF